MRGDILLLFEMGDQTLRQRILNIARNTGRVEFVKLVAGTHRDRNAIPADDNWETMLSILTANKRWNELWDITLQAPVQWSILMIRELQKAEWKPSRPDQQQLYTSLLNIAMQVVNCEFTSNIDCQAILRTSPQWVNTIAFNPNGKVLAVGSSGANIYIIRLNDGKCIATLSGHKDAIRCVIYNKKGTVLASSSNDSTIRQWQVANDRPMNTITTGANTVWSMDFDQTDGMLISGTTNQEIVLWDTTSGYSRARMECPGCQVWTIAAHPNNDYFVAGTSTGSVCLWDKSSQKLIKEAIGHHRPVRSLAFSSDGSLIASSCSGGNVRLWQCDPPLEQVRIPLSHPKAVFSLAFHPDQPLLATACDDNLVRIWDSTTGKLTHILEGHSDRLCSVAYSRDGYYLASGGFDGTLRVWDLRTVFLQAVLKVPLSQVNRTQYVKIMKLWHSGVMIGNEKSLLEYIYTVSHARYQYDIEITTLEQAQPVGKYDVEIEMV